MLISMRTAVALIIAALVSCSSSVAQWVQTAGLPVAPVKRLMAPGGPDLFAGTDAGLFRSRNNGALWAPINAGMIDSSISGLGVAGMYFFAGTSRGNVYRSTNAGDLWEATAWQTTTPLNALAVMGTDVFIGTSGSSVQRSTDFGVSWFAAGSGLPPFCTSLVVYDTTIFARVNAPGIQMSTNRGGTWSTIASTVPSPTGAVTVMGGIIFIGAASNVQFSTDNGTNWRISDAGLPAKAVRGLATIGGNLFSCVDSSGVFLSTNAGSSWSPVNDGLSDLIVSGLSFNGTDLFVYGSGVWRRPLSQMILPLVPLVSFATDQSTTSFSALWHESSYAEGYRLDVSTDAGFATVLMAYNNLAVAFPPVSVTGLTPGTRYFYRVRAENSAGISGNSDPVEVWTVPLAPALKPPTAITSNGFTVNWSATKGAMSYRLDVATDMMFTSPVPGNQDLDTGPDTTHSLIGLSPNKSYYYQVRAVNTGGTSQNSTAGEALTAPAPPILKAATVVTSSSFTVNWNASSGALGYSFDVSPDGSFSTFVIGYDDKQVGGDTSSVVMGLEPNTAYHFRVRASNQGGWSQSSPEGIQITAPAPPFANPATSLAIGSFVASWTASPGATGYRLDVATDSLFTGYVSGFNDHAVAGTSQQVTGLTGNTEYFYRVRAQNGSLTGDNSNFVGVRTLPGYAGTYTLLNTTTYPTHDNLTQYDSADYHLIGIPGNSGLDISNFLQGSHKANWQVYWDNGKLTTPHDYYVEYQAQNSIFTCTTGKAFWLLNRGDWVLNTQVSTAPLNASSEVIIPLTQGRTWHLITNPFNANILWSGVTAINGIKDSITTWDGQKYARSSVFQPYKGYLFFNDSSRTSLRVPYALTLGKTASKHTVIERAQLATMVVRSGKYSDETTLFGIAPGAAVGLDSYEQRKPRALAGVAEAYFDRPDWDPVFHEFATDIRPSIGSLQEWDIKIRSDERGPVSLEFEGITNFPAQYAVELIDKSGARAVDLRKESTYLLQPSTKITALDILVGDPDLVKKRVDDIVPTDFALLQNYPNPFNPATTITVVLPEKSHVVLRVYDVLGQFVKMLFEGNATTGKQFVNWDGTDASGRKLPSGVYFCHMDANGQVKRTIRMTLLK